MEMYVITVNGSSITLEDGTMMGETTKEDGERASMNTTMTKPGGLEGEYSKEFVDPVPAKLKDTVQMFFMSVDCLPFFNRYHKNSKIHSLIHRHEVDIMGMAETIVNWKNIPFDYRLRERVST